MGYVVVDDDRVLRVVNESWRPVFEFLENSPTAKSLVDDGRLITSQEISSATETRENSPGVSPDQFLLEHDKVSFPSFAYEWPWEMLQAAAELTLDLASVFIKDDIRLKDATPFNVLFQGPKPVFIDILSFEKGALRDSLWRPEGQFTQTFLLPILLKRLSDTSPHQMFIANREGISPEEVYRRLSGLARMRWSCLWLVTLPTLLANQAKNPEIYRERSEQNPEKSIFLLESVMRRLQRNLKRVTPKTRQSVWSEYERTHSYSSDAFSAKQKFVDRHLREISPNNVMDIGCNEGTFTFLAAETGAFVVAIDYDATVVGRVWKIANQRGLNVLPLVQNLSSPSPATGWRYREFSSFLDRARGQFDVVMMLAVIHHLLVTDRVPIDDIFDLIAEITTDYLIIEYVGPSDPMFRSIARGRDDLFSWYNQTTFEAAAMKHFSILDTEPLAELDRTLYLLRRHDQNQ